MSEARWSRVSFPEKPVLAMRAKSEPPVTRFKTMTDEALLEAAGKRLPRAEVVGLLTEGFCRRLLNATGEARLLKLLREDEAARLETQQEARFRALHGGLSECELATAMQERRAR